MESFCDDESVSVFWGGFLEKIDAQVYLCLLYRYLIFLHMDLVMDGGGKFVTTTRETSAWGLGRRLKFGAVTEYCSVGGVSCLVKMRTKKSVVLMNMKLTLVLGMSLIFTTGR